MGEHYREERPWGAFTNLEESEGYKVKRIEVKPGKRLSLQWHHHRSEHWTVVRGEGEVTVGERVFRVGVNESAFIPQQAKHRVFNPGNDPLVIIEVQVGDYLGEDDIVRLEDDFGRISQ